MKIILTVVISLLLCFPIVAQTKTDREQEQLKGEVKTVAAYRIEFSLKDGKHEPSKRISWYSHSFNPEGNLIQRLTYDPSGNILERIVYNFDSKGRKIGYDEYHTIKGELIKVPRKHVYTLDDNGNRIEYRVFESNGNPAGRFTYKYDSNGNKIEDGYYYYTGIFGGKTIYTYDGKGNQTSHVSYSPEQVINGKSISIYDSQGNKIEEHQYRWNTLKYKIVNKYDDKRRVVETETIEFNATGNPPPTHSPIPGKIIYKYDDQKRTTDTAQYLPDGTLVARLRITFDNLGNEIERVTFNADGSEKPSEVRVYDNTSPGGFKLIDTLAGKSVIEYELDLHCNWTKKTSLIQMIEMANDINRKAYSGIERQITYY